jgi:hypothetical protein
MMAASNEVNKAEKASAAMIAMNLKDFEAGGCIFSPFLPTSLSLTAVEAQGRSGRPMTCAWGA